jgi:hypothetical protein
MDVGGVRDVVEHGRLGLSQAFGDARALRSCRRCSAMRSAPKNGGGRTESIVANLRLDGWLTTSALYRELIRS